MLEKLKQEIASNSYIADQHEENEMVIKSSRVIEIVGENLKSILEEQMDISTWLNIGKKYKYDKYFYNKFLKDIPEAHESDGWENARTHSCCPGDDWADGWNACKKYINK